MMNHVSDASDVFIDDARRLRRDEVRELRVVFERDGDGWAPGHDFRIEVPVGRSTFHSITLNARELRAWARALSEAADEAEETR